MFEWQKSVKGCLSVKSTRPGTSSKLSLKSSPNSSSKLDNIDNNIKLDNMDNLNNLDNMDNAIEVAIDNDEPNKINVTIVFIINPAISSDCYE